MPANPGKLGGSERWARAVASDCKTIAAFAREADGKTLAEVATAASIPVDNLSDIEKGFRVPLPRQAANLSKVLRVPEADLQDRPTAENRAKLLDGLI